MVEYNKSIVLICTDRREEITTANIKSLCLQKPAIDIVLVVSDPKEIRYYASLCLPNMTIVAHANRPLGTKFQRGVDIAKKMKPKFLVILGSDDILGKDFIKNADRMISSGTHFIGLKQWFIYHQETLFLYQYRPEIPLGTRVYSYEMMDKMGGKLFDEGRDRLLDDFGFNAAKKTGLKMHIMTNVMGTGMYVISVKGDWPMLNPYSKMKDHPNCELLRTYTDLSEFL